MPPQYGDHEVSWAFGGVQKSDAFRRRRLGSGSTVSTEEDSKHSDSNGTSRENSQNLHKFASAAEDFGGPSTFGELQENGEFVETLNSFGKNKRESWKAREAFYSFDSSDFAGRVSSVSVSSRKQLDVLPEDDSNEWYEGAGGGADVVTDTDETPEADVDDVDDDGEADDVDDVDEVDGVEDEGVVEGYDDVDEGALDDTSIDAWEAAEREWERMETAKSHFEDFNDHEDVVQDPSEDLDSFTRQQVEAAVKVEYTPAKGRCLFTRDSKAPGDIIFIEDPVMVAVPSIEPKLWKQLVSLNQKKAFALPPVWHLAAICSITQLDKTGRDIIRSKWVPDPSADASEDVVRVMSRIPELRGQVSPQLYERFLQAWRFNSFSHHTETEGLVLYNTISMMAHSCSSSATWHYGFDCSFVLRARQHLAAGAELTISYVGDEDIHKATHLRRERLAPWLFKCMCMRCASPIDVSRGFCCPTCVVGTVYIKTESGETGVGDTWSITADDTHPAPCTVCDKKMTQSEVEEYIAFEDAYIERLEVTSSEDMSDVNIVFREAQRVFTHHWIMYSLSTMLFGGYKAEGSLLPSLTHLTQRIKFLSSVTPKMSFTIAWMHEEKGDLVYDQYFGKYEGENDDDEKRRVALMTEFERGVLESSFESATSILNILSGPSHEHSIAVRRKMERVREVLEDLAEES